MEEAQTPASAPLPDAHDGGGHLPVERILRHCCPALSRHYTTPVFQISLIGLICFCCPGMFNAVHGLGAAGGHEDPRAASNGLTALYAAFALFGLLGGGIYNLLGPHKAFFFGCSFYVLYVASLLYCNHRSNQAFVVAAGALLGMGAGLLWAGQGAMMMAYPSDDRKGIYISLFWSIFNLGGVAGSFIPFALNYHTAYGFDNDQTYVAFMVVMSLGTLLTLALAKPEWVVREDGSRPVSTTSLYTADWRSELWSVLKLFGDWRMLLLAPASFGSNFFYTYQFNNVNGDLFDVRTRAFNNAFYWAAQMLGSVSIGYILDHAHKRRRTRGLIGCTLLTLLCTAIWGGGLAAQLRYSRAHPPLLPKLDFKQAAYAGPFLLYLSYGLLGAMFQTLCYWTIGALTDDTRTLSRYSGFYKGVQSAGAAIAWHIDTQRVSLLSELVTNWTLMTLSLPLLWMLVALAVQDPSSRPSNKDAFAHFPVLDILSPPTENEATPPL